MYPRSRDAPVFPERMFSPLLDLSNPLHCLDRGLHELAVVSHRDISPFLEFDGGVLCRLVSIDIGITRKGLTMVISFPAAFLKAFVHLTFRGLRFILVGH